MVDSSPSPLVHQSNDLIQPNGFVEVLRITRIRTRWICQLIQTCLRIPEKTLGICIPLVRPTDRNHLVTVRVVLNVWLTIVNTGKRQRIATIVFGTIRIQTSSKSLTCAYISKVSQIEVVHEELTARFICRRINTRNNTIDYVKVKYATICFCSLWKNIGWRYCNHRLTFNVLDGCPFGKISCTNNSPAVRSDFTQNISQQRIRFSELIQDSRLPFIDIQIADYSYEVAMLVNTLNNITILFVCNLYLLGNIPIYRVSTLYLKCQCIVAIKLVRYVLLVIFQLKRYNVSWVCIVVNS